NRTTQTILQILLTYYLTKFHIFFLVCYVLFERSKSTKKTGANRLIWLPLLSQKFLNDVCTMAMPLAFYLTFVFVTLQASLQVTTTNVI
ncbi:MAG: hypothetical protein J6R31_00650, partial [Rikenellaceae bacterium]|nr:hypothetical protein [Rikenellaceae bacterium]